MTKEVKITTTDFEKFQIEEQEKKDSGTNAQGGRIVVEKPKEPTNYQENT